MTAAQLLADQAPWFADFPPETLIIGGVSYSVLTPRAEDRNDWQMGGLHDEPRLSVIFNRNAAPLPSAIPAGSLVTFRGANFRIVRVQEDHPQSPLLVELESARILPEPVVTPLGDRLITPGGDRIITPR